MEEIFAFIDRIFGLDADELTIWHVLIRCLFIYIIGIILVRLGNKRFVGKMSAFDIMLAIIIGSMLSRAITSDRQFFSIIAACLLLILLHRSFSKIAAYSDGFGSWIKGSERLIVKDGEILWEEMHKSNLSEKDLMQNLRLNGNVSDVKNVKEARLERNGDISVIKKEKD